MTGREVERTLSAAPRPVPENAEVSQDRVPVRG